MGILATHLMACSVLLLGQQPAASSLASRWANPWTGAGTYATVHAQLHVEVILTRGVARPL